MKHFNLQFFYSLFIMISLSACIENRLALHDPDDPSSPHLPFPTNPSNPPSPSSPDLPHQSPTPSTDLPEPPSSSNARLEQPTCDLEYYVIPELIDGIVLMKWREITEFATRASSGARQAILHDDALIHQDTSRYIKIHQALRCSD